MEGGGSLTVGKSGSFSMGKVPGAKGVRSTLPGVPGGGLPGRQVSHSHLMLVVGTKPGVMRWHSTARLETTQLTFVHNLSVAPPPAIWLITG